MTLKPSLLRAVAAAALVLFTASACSTTEEPVSPPVAFEIGTEYAQWQPGADGAVNAALDEYGEEHEPILITTTSEWDSWLAELPPELAELPLPYRPGFEESFMVIGSFTECGANPQVVSLEQLRVKFETWPDEDADCESVGTTIHMTLVDRDEIGAEPDDEIRLMN